MKIGLLADVHLGIRPYGLEKRREDVFNSFLKALEALEDVDLLVIAGDLLDKKQVDYDTLVVLSELKRFQDRIFCVDGNHDQGLRKLLSSFIKFDASTTLDLGKFVLFGLDYDVSHRKLYDAIQKFNPEKPAILVGHFVLYEVLPFFESDDSFLRLDELKKFALVVNGHLHVDFQTENYVSIPTVEALKANAPCGKVYVLEVTDYDLKLHERHIPTRKVIRTRDKDEVLRLAEREAIPPVVFFVGEKSHFTERELAFVERKTLFFKIEKDVEKVVSELVEEDVVVAPQVSVLGTLADLLSQARVSEPLRKIFLESYPDVKLAESALRQYVFERLEGENGSKDLKSEKENRRALAQDVAL